MSCQLSITPTETNQLQLICEGVRLISEPFPGRQEMLKAIEPDNLLGTIEDNFPDFDMPIDVWGITVGDKWYAVEEISPGAFDPAL